MAEGMLPPLILELRARAGELITEVKTAASETEKAAARTKVAAEEVEASSVAAAEGSVAATEKAGAGWSKFMGVSKAAAIGVAGATVVIGVESLKMAGNFDAAVTRLHTAAGESESNLKTVSNGLLSIARSTGTSTEQLTAGMYQIESAGFHGADGLKVMQAAAQGAKNEGADLEGVGNALTTVMDDLGAKSGKAADLMSQMVAAVGQGKMKMDDLAGSIHSVLPNAAALGISFPQVAGALATMTAEGVSAEQAAQNLNHTIVKLAAPTTAMSNAMAAYGVNSEQLKNNLGKNGLTGTFDILSKAILDHMGPSGLALMDTFNKSKTAAADVQKMLKNLPPDLQKLGDGFLKGTVGQKEFQKAAKESGAAGSAQGAQFMKLAQTANGFSDALKSGKSDAQTFNQAMYSMLGDQTGLQVALHLTGDHMQTFKDNVKVIGKASADANGNVKDWAVTQETFNNRMARLKEAVQTAAIAIGQHLMPPVNALIGYLANHQGVLIAVAGTIGGLLVAAAAAWAYQLAKTAATNVVSFAKDMAGAVKWAAAQAASIGETVALWAMYAAEGIGRAAAASWSAFTGMIGKAAAWAAATAASVGETVALWAMYAAEGIGKAVTATAEAAASMGAQIAAWATQLGEQIATTVAGFLTWAAEHTAMAATFIAENLAMAASATAAFVAENAATLGIGALIALLVTGIVWLATHWKEAWHAIETAAKWAYENVLRPVGQWIEDHVLKPIGAAIGFLFAVWKAEWDAIGTAAKWVYDKVIQPVAMWIVDHAILPIHNGIQTLHQIWQAAWNGIGNAAHSVYTGFIQPIANWIVNNAILPIHNAVKAFGDIWSSIWNGIGNAVHAVWSFIKPIFDAIGSAIHTVTSGISAIGNGVGKVASFLGFDNGGWIPGSPGAPQLVVAHGGEYVLSRDMLAGRQAVDDDLFGNVKSANGYAPAAGGDPSQLALAGGAPAGAASAPAAAHAAAPSSGGGPTVIVNAYTNASARQIASEAGWELRKQAS